MELDEKINKLIDQATDELASGSVDKSAQALQELAYICKGSYEMFCHLRKLVVVGAESKCDRIFVRETLEAAECKLREERNGTIIIH